MFGLDSHSTEANNARYHDALDTLDRLSDEVAAEWFDMDNVRLSDALH